MQGDQLGEFVCGYWSLNGWGTIKSCTLHMTNLMRAWINGWRGWLWGEGLSLLSQLICEMVNSVDQGNFTFVRKTSGNFRNLWLWQLFIKYNYFHFQEEFAQACVSFLRRRCPHLLGVSLDKELPKSVQLPQETVVTVLSCLQSFLGWG